MNRREEEEEFWENTDYVPSTVDIFRMIKTVRDDARGFYVITLLALGFLTIAAFF